jgi:hypothetical protein
VGRHPRVNMRALAPVAFVALVAAAGCGKGATSSAGATVAVDAEAPVAVASTPDVPADHLAPGELVEGNEQAFGLTLPRGMLVEQRLPGVVTVSGPVGVPPLITYLRAHLVGGAMTKKENATSFDHVKLIGHADGPELEIYITRLPARTMMQVLQPAPVPPSTLPDEASRWRAAGLTPEGKLLDPMHQ